MALAQAATGWPLPALRSPTLLPSAYACSSTGGAFRPRPLPAVDVEGKAARRLKEVFGRVLEADPEEQRRKKKREGDRARRAGVENKEDGEMGGGAAAASVAARGGKGKRKR